MSLVFIPKIPNHLIKKVKVKQHLITESQIETLIKMRSEGARFSDVAIVLGKSCTYWGREATRLGVN